MSLKMSQSKSWGGKLRVKFDIARYSPHETTGEYAETDFVLRVWHPCFRDMYCIPANSMAKARYTDTLVPVASVEFKDPWPEYIDKHGNLEVPDDASLGMHLYAKTFNDLDQDCVKYQGAFRGVTLSGFAAIRVPGYPTSCTYTDVEFIDEAIESSVIAYPVRHTSTGVKACIDKMVVTMISITRGASLKPMSPALGVANFDVASRERLNSFVAEISNFHNRVPLAVPNLRKYYSLQYKVAPNVILPASAYMIQVMDERSEKVSGEVAMQLLTCTLAEHPEFHESSTDLGKIVRSPLEAWISKCEEYLECNVISGPDCHTTDTDGALSFMDCLIVAMETLSCEPTAEPYLLDIEADTYSRRKSHFYTRSTDAKSASKHVHHPDLVTSTVPVERFATSIMEGYGPDCEDDDMFEYKLKQDIQRQFISSPNRALRTLARIYELFIAFGTHMKCKGDDNEREIDDGVYHHALYILPRVYVEECCSRNGTQKNPFSKRTKGSRPWETLYANFLGVFIIEGTNTVCPAQFTFVDRVVEDIRNENAMAACTGLNGVKDHTATKLLRVYNSLVYSQPKQLSSFYRWACGFFTEEGDDPLLLDYCFTNIHRQKGVRVEQLAAMTDGVCITPVVKYTPAVMALCKRVLALYRYPVKTIAHVDQDDADRHINGLMKVIMANKYISDMCSRKSPSTCKERRAYVRVHVQHLDFSTTHGTRCSQMIRALEEVGRAISATAVEVNIHSLGGIWCAAENMKETRDNKIQCLLKVSLTYFY